MLFHIALGTFLIKEIGSFDNGTLQSLEFNWKQGDFN